MGKHSKQRKHTARPANRKLGRRSVPRKAQAPRAAAGRSTKPGSRSEAVGEAPEKELVEVEGELVEETVAAVPRVAAERESARGDLITCYMRDVHRHALLSPEEEHSLAVRVHERRDPKAAAQLVLSNLRLVVKIANEYRRVYRSVTDLVQEGNIGLMHAVERFDPYRGVKLSSYAAWWIRAYILRYILGNWRLVRIGTTQAQRKLFFNLKREKARLAALGVEPTPSRVAKNLGVPEKDVVEMDQRLARCDASLDLPVTDGEERSPTRLDLLRANGPNPEAAAEASEVSALVRDRVASFRDTLSGRHRVIFDRRIVAEDPITLQELAADFGLSRERVRQLEARIVRKLREELQVAL
jgi:RNA polymerase sigma-32 factor